MRHHHSTLIQRSLAILLAGTASTAAFAQAESSADGDQIVVTGNRGQARTAVRTGERAQLGVVHDQAFRRYASCAVTEASAASRTDGSTSA